MKRIILLRHAKAVQQEDGLPDHTRALQQRGRIEAEKIARKTKKHGFIPEVILSSTALRAKETAVIFAQVFGYPDKDIQFIDTLYGDLTENALIGLVKGLNPNTASIMIVGHEPSISDSAKYFTRGFSENVPPGGIVAIDFKADSWDEVRKSAGELVLFDFP
jgi:phosphohistidine phosphatase